MNNEAPLSLSSLRKFQAFRSSGPEARGEDQIYTCYYKSQYHRRTLPWTATKSRNQLLANLQILFKFHQLSQQCQFFLFGPGSYPGIYITFSYCVFSHSFSLEHFVSLSLSFISLTVLSVQAFTLYDDCQPGSFWCLRMTRLRPCVLDRNISETVLCSSLPHTRRCKLSHHWPR